MSGQDLLYASLEELLNRYLALSPESAERLGRLHGRVIAFELTGPGITLFLIPGPGRLQLFNQYAGEADCRIRGTPMDLMGLGKREKGHERIFSGDVSITGDTELAHRFGNILGELEIDWEEQLSHLTGDIIAHETGNLFRYLGRWAKEGRETLGLNLREYLQEERRLLPERDEIETFLEQVDRLRDDTERLQARLELLASRLAHGDTSDKDGSRGSDPGTRCACCISTGCCCGMAWMK